MNFIIEFAPDDKRPMYQQLSDALENAIRCGRLKPGDHMPSTRELAEELELARGTIVRSYDDLLNKGYLEGKSGTGTKIVAKISGLIATDGTATDAHESEANGVGKRQEQRQLENLAAGTTSSLTARTSKQLSKYGQRLLDLEISSYTSGDLPALNYGCTPKDLLPLKQWRELLSRHCRLESSDTLAYVTEPFGYRPLREGVCNYLVRTKGVRCHPDQVIIFSGSQQALNHILSVLVDDEDTVVVENPGYVGIREKLMAQGAFIEPIEVDKDGLRVDLLEQIESNYKLIHVTPSCHDPTGVQMSADRRAALLDLAKRKECLILEDAWDADFIYAGAAAPSLQGASDGSSVIYLYSLFKVIYPLTTLTVAVIPTHLIPVFTRDKLLTERQVPALAYCALSDFINEGHLDAQIRRTQKIYRKRRQLLMYALTTAFRENITISPKSAGLHLRVRFSPSLNGDTILSCATAAAVPLVGTTPYYCGNAPINEYLIAFSHLLEETTHSQIQMFADLIKNSAA